MRGKGDIFPELETFTAIDHKRDTYLGPTMESNWVLPGRLLVGAYPASMNDSHHAHLLCTILLQGVSTFVCLQQEYKAQGVTEVMWRSGEALRPYFQDVLQLLRKLRELKSADPRAVPVISAPESTDFVHFPIVDCNVADDTKVCAVCVCVVGLTKWLLVCLYHTTKVFSSVFFWSLAFSFLLENNTTDSIRPLYFYSSIIELHIEL